MKKILFLLSIILINAITVFAVGLPHSAYFEVYSLNDTTVTYPDTVSFRAWIIGREDEVLTEQSFGCAYYKDKNVASVQVGNFTTPWSIGENLEIEIHSNLGDGQKVITLTKNAAQWYVRNYQGKDGIKVKQNKKLDSTSLLNAKVFPNNVKFSFSIKKGDEATLTIYRQNSDFVKEITLTSNDDTYTLDTTKLSSGLYFYKLESPTYSKIKKVMIIK